MVKIKTIEEIEQEVKCEVKSRNERKRQGLIEDMTDEIRSTLEGKYYFNRFEFETEKYSISDVKEVANEIGCSVINFQDKIYLCIEKVPDEERIKRGFLSDYDSEMTTLFCIPVLIFMLCALVTIYQMMSMQTFDIPTENLPFMIGFILFSFSPMLIIFISMINLGKKKLTYTDGVYTL